jgi:hypothetical protein
MYNTNEEVFDTVRSHFAARLLGGSQELARTEKGRCLYRLEKDGQVLKCAVGCLIPDEMYNERMEYKPLSYVIDTFASASFLLFSDNVDEAYLVYLQRLHDNSHNVSGFMFLLNTVGSPAQWKAITDARWRG